MACAPPPGAALKQWRQRILPAQARAAGAQGLHCFQAALPLRPGLPTVQTVHELAWRHGVRESGAWRRMAWVAWGRRKAARIVTATEFTARDLGAAPPGRVRVIPWGLTPGFSMAKGARDLEWLARVGLTPGRYVLSPGGLPRKKEPELLVAAITDLRQAGHGDLQLLFTAPRGGDLGRNLARPGVTCLPGLEDAQLAILYRHALRTLVLSRSEGFSLPILESLASGTGVVVREGTAQAEVAGLFAETIPGGERTALVAHLAQAAAEAPATHLREARVAYAQQFSWDHTAQGIEDLWQEILGA
ncbi:MAG: glycosyltransferase [Planctomycetota bacterium]